MSAKYRIGRFEFATKEAIKERCREALYAGPRGSVLNGEDAELAMAVLRRRPDKLEAIGDAAVVRFVRLGHAFNTTSFHAELSDGRTLDFSFQKVVNALKPIKDAAPGAPVT